MVGFVTLSELKALVNFSSKGRVPKMTQTEYGLRIAPRSIQEFLSFFPVTCGAVDKIINSLPKDQDGRVVMPSYIDIHNEKECILLHFVYSENGKVRIIKFNIAEQVIAPR